MTSDVIVWTGNTVKLSNFPSYLIWQGDVEKFLDRLQQADVSFDLVVTSPPYNMGKKYERRTNLAEYLTWQERVISKTVRLLSPTGSLCWQVGNFVDEGAVLPLDLVFHPIMERLGLTLRNRIVWRFGHGLHCKRRFSGRYEVQQVISRICMDAEISSDYRAKEETEAERSNSTRIQNS